MRHRHDLGVLFVHGIGQQAQGETLVQAADALLSYFDAGPHTRGQVDLEGVELRPETGPARARLRFRRSPADGIACDRTWLLAEAWWAESFLPQRFGELVGWASRSLPYAVLTHVGAMLKRRWSELRSARGSAARVMQLLALLPTLLLLAVSPQIAVVAMLLLLLLSTLALVPLAVLRTPATWLQAKLAATLGDSAILSSSETNRAAMVERIRRDLRWLAARGVNRIVVVAHSQGAALGWEALQDQVPAKVTGFRTFGSGLKKLLMLRLAGQPEKRVFGYAWGAALAQIVAIVIGLWLVNGISEGTIQAGLVTFGAWVVLLFLAFAPTAAIEALGSSKELSRWNFVLLCTSTMAVAIPLLLAWKGNPRWSWFAAGFVSLWAAAFGVHFTRKLLARFPGARDRLLMLFLVLAAAALSALVLWWPDSRQLQAAICLVVAVSLFLATALAAATDDPVAWNVVTGSLEARGIHWEDWYATSDPVATGRFEPLGKKSKPVTNLERLLADHTAYWANRDELVADLAASLAGSAGWKLGPVAPEVRQRRRWRVQVLKASGYIAWLGVAAALWFKGGELGAIGERIALFLRDALLRLPSDLAAALGRRLDGLGGDGRWLAGLLAVVAPILVLRSAVGWRWRQWNEREARRSIASPAFVKEKQAAFLWTFSVYVVGVAFFALPPPWNLMSPALLGFALGFGESLARVAPKAPVERKASQPAGPPADG